MISLTRLWQDHGPNTYPIDIDALIGGVFGSPDFPDKLTVRRDHFDSFEGCLVKLKGIREWTILINQKQTNMRRRRFTFAHELGHFMCHRNQKERFNDDRNSLNDFRNKIEAEANLFASWLLMPANHLRTEFGKLDWTIETLQSIANRFEASLQASAIRYIKLSERPIAFVLSRDGMIDWTIKSDSAPFLTAFRGSEELPDESHAKRQHEEGDSAESVLDSGFAWSEHRQSRESQYFDQSGNGYQYTCIEFY